MLKIENDTLIIDNVSFDHIMCWELDECPLENFKKGLENELFMSGLEEQKYNKIQLKFD